MALVKDKELRLNDTRDNVTAVMSPPSCWGALTEDEPSEPGHITVAVEEQAVGHLSIPASPARLLVVALDGFGQGGVDHVAHVGLVNAHSKGNGCTDHLGRTPVLRHTLWTLLLQTRQTSRKPGGPRISVITVQNKYNRATTSPPARGAAPDTGKTPDSSVCSAVPGAVSEALLCSALPCWSCATTFYSQSSQ